MGSVSAVLTLVDLSVGSVSAVFKVSIACTTPPWNQFFPNKIFIFHLTSSNFRTEAYAELSYFQWKYDNFA